MIYAFFFVLSLVASPGFSIYPVNEPNAVKMIKHLTDRVQQARIMDEKILAAKYEIALWNLIINGETDRETTHYDNQEIETTVQKSYGIRSTGPTPDELPIMMAAIDQLAISASEKSWATIPTHWTLIQLKNKENLGHYNGAKRLLEEAIKKYNPKGAIQMPQGKTLHPFQTVLDITTSNAGAGFMFPYNDSAFRGVIYVNDTVEHAIQNNSLRGQSIKDICPWVKRAWVGWDTIGKPGVKDFFGAMDIRSQTQNSSGTLDVRMFYASGSFDEDRGIPIANWGDYLDTKDELSLGDETYRPTIKRVQAASPQSNNTSATTQPVTPYRQDISVTMNEDGDYIVEEYSESSTSSNVAGHHQRSTSTARISPKDWIAYCNARGWDPSTIRIERAKRATKQSISSADVLLGGMGTNPLQDLK